MYLRTHPSALYTYFPFQETSNNHRRKSLPNHETHLPNHETLLPYHETNLPYRETLLPCHEMSLPKYETLLPYHEMSLPNHETHLPSREIHLPYHGATSVLHRPFPPAFNILGVYLSLIINRIDVNIFFSESSDINFLSQTINLYSYTILL
jgi:hypothetical protein